MSARHLDSGASDVPSGVGRIHGSVVARLLIAPAITFAVAFALAPLIAAPPVLATLPVPAAVSPPAGAAPAAALPVSAVETVGITVSNLARSIEFFTAVLDFRLLEESERSGRDFELATGVFGARARVARLALGRETIELTEFLAPRGRPVPDDVRPNDASFQHVAIIVSDMDRAYARLRQHGVRHASSGPQLLPAWNPNAGGIRAFYFRDPDGHFLEILQFPPGKGRGEWQRKDALFLGIDHTAIVSRDTERSLAFYRDLLRMPVAGESDNYDIEQEHLNGVFGARLRITAVRAAAGPGIELLEYLAPRDGRPAPVDLRANDLSHWETTLVTDDLTPATALARGHLFALVSPFAVPAARDGRTLLIRDPDAHAIRLQTAR